MTSSQKNNILNHIKSLWLITRPRNAFLAGIAVILGIVSSHGTKNLEFISDIFLDNIFYIILAYFASVFIAAGGYTINDYYDYEIDVHNRPDRILPSRQLSLKIAVVWADILFVAGFICAYLLFDILAVFLALVGIISLLLYGKYFKKQKEIGNLVVSVLTVIPIFYGGVIVNNYLGPLFVAVFCFLVSISREIHKDIEDVPGDSQDEQLSSIPIRFGANLASKIANAYLVVAILLSPVPILLKFYHSWFYILGFVILDAMFFYILWITYKASKKDVEAIYVASKVSRKILKLIYFFGALVFIVDPIFPFVL